MTRVELGWTDFFEEAFRPHAEREWIAGRVMAQFRGGYAVLTESGEYLADVSGKFRHQAEGPADFPAVGDWVAFNPPAGSGRSVIHARLPRRTTFSRNIPGEATVQQVLAANIDTVFIVEPLSSEPNVRRIERFLALAWESGARPAVVLTKVDLCGDPDAALAAARAVAGEAPVNAVCGLTGKGLRALRPHLKTGKTAVLLGASGAGKSTLINALCDEDIQYVIPVRDSDHKGRHTTTHRELFQVPEGGWIIDTPGLREVQLWDASAGVGEAFADIETLALTCRFTNCTHQAEPGCAVRTALTDGKLEATRFASFQKLREEAQKFVARHDVRVQANEKRRLKTITRALREHPKFRRQSGEDPG